MIFTTGINSFSTTSNKSNLSEKSTTVQFWSYHILFCVVDIHECKQWDWWLLGQCYLYEHSWFLCVHVLRWVHWRWIELLRWVPRFSDQLGMSYSINLIRIKSVLTKKSWSSFECILTDINECNEIMHMCSNNAACNNTFGSYECECFDGFTVMVLTVLVSFACALNLFLRTLLVVPLS